MDDRPAYLMTDASRTWTEAFFRHVGLTSPEPIGLVVDRAAGPWIVADDGRRYLDLLAGIGVANIGHTHPEVVAAVDRQNRRHHHVMVYGEYVQEEQALYAAELVRVFPAGLDRVFFVNSGAEAVEAALKLARKATGRARFAAFEGGYHGDTFGALSVCGNAIYRDSFEPLLGPVLRLPFGRVDALGGLDERIAAVIVEPVQGEGGVRVPPPTFLPALRARCTEVGALLVLDEVMTGFGRTGRLFACEHGGVVPDILVLAKALGGGFPLGAIAAPTTLLQTFTHDPPLAHVTTFGGHPVSCAAGRAALNVLLRDGLAAAAAKRGARFRDALRAVFAGDDAVREVRGLGHMTGIELSDGPLTARFTARCRDRGLLVGWTLHQDAVLRLTPPLGTPAGALEEAAGVMAAALREAKR